MDDFFINSLTDYYDRFLIKHRRRTEINKFKDIRRQRIVNSRLLTDEEKREVDAFYLSHYGERIPYIWHQYYTAFTGQFDPLYFPELLYIPEFEHFMNPYPEYVKVFADKNILPLLASNINVKTPKVFLSVCKGVFRDGLYRHVKKNDARHLLFNLGDAFMKPTVDSSSGRGCQVLNIISGCDLISGKSVEELLQTMPSDYVIQERLQCHESIANLYKDSVNTFRVITYRWNDEIKHCPTIMRIGSHGAFLDNAHAGGMFIGIDDDGTLHDVAFTEFNNSFSEHPDSKILFKDYRISLFPKILAAAETLHVLIPQLGLINWDFTLGNDGVPILIEANTFGGSIWLSEIAHGKGAFGLDTGDILRWIAQQKKLKKSKRKAFYFGIIVD